MSKAQESAKVAVLGASTNTERYSYKAVKMLSEYGFKPLPVHPAGHEVLGLTAAKSLGELSDKVDTLTVYVGPKISATALESIIALAPRRVIFNPGAENQELAEKLTEAGMEVVEACTLVMLKTDQF